MWTYVFPILWFLLLYFLPFLTYIDQTASLDKQTLQILYEGLAIPAVFWGVLGNVMAQILLPVTAALFLVWSGQQLFSAFEKVVKIDRRIRACLQVLLMTLAWLGLAGWNEKEFELSNYSSLISSVSVPWVLYGSSVLVVAVAALGFWTWLVDRTSVRYVLLLPVIFLAMLLLPKGSIGHLSKFHEQQNPNIIIIGIDSLSASTFETHSEKFPTLQDLKSHASWYKNAYTPLARTFPAWMSLLSGRQAAETGAVFNLVDLQSDVKADLVTQDLKRKGYRTVLAFDERRFSALDHSYGFDEVIGPRLGVVDFLVQKINDAPFSNFILQTRLGSQLFPYSYLNVASYVNYSEKLFVDEIMGVLQKDRPVFLATHFLSGHYPFQVRTKNKINFGHGLAGRYLRAQSFVDQQLSYFIYSLQEDGYLNNAVIYLVSDHGESVGGAEIIEQLDGVRSSISMHGHGTDVLRDDQNRIVMGVVRYRDGIPVSKAEVRSEMVSLMDIRHSINNLIDVGVYEIKPMAECFFVETGLRLKSVADYENLKADEVVKEGLGYYRIDKNGVMSLRPSWVDVLVKAKDLGYRCADRISLRKASGERSSYAISSHSEHRVLKEIEPVSGDEKKISEYRNMLMR